jgi:hypothetical protein
MKTRIKAVTLRNESTVYYAQYKGLLFWHTVQDDGFYSAPQQYATKEEAAKVLDAILANRQEQKEKKLALKQLEPVSHTYIKHP